MREVGSIVGGKYRLIRELGKGAAAHAWQAENELVGRSVALKMLRPEVSADEGVKTRFLAEAKAAAKLAHPNVVDVFDLGTEEDGAPFIVMELCDGDTLSQILRERGAVGIEYACEIMIQVLAALHAAHALGIVHRDLKPDNIMVIHPRPDRPVVKVLDFGIALGLLAAAEEPDADAPNRLFGTPDYMAPEQARGDEVDARADLYAAGAILYELLAAQPPFTGETLVELLSRLMREKPTPLSELAPAVPPTVDALVTRALEKDPAKRPQTAREFIDALTAVATSVRVPSVIPRGESEPPLPLIQERDDLEAGRQSDAPLPLVNERGADDKKGKLELVFDSGVPPPPGTPGDSSD